MKEPRNGRAGRAPGDAARDEVEVEPGQSTTVNGAAQPSATARAGAVGVDAACWHLRQHFATVADRPFFAVLWSKKNGATFHRTDNLDEELTESGAARKRISREPSDLYFGLNPLHRKPATGRGTKRDIAAVLDVPGDLDIGIDGHQKTYSGDGHAALELQRRLCELDPSIRINSGGGVHVHYLLADPIIFSNDDERLADVPALARFRDTGKRAAAALGVAWDSVQDTTRILRIAGTVNAKLEGNPRPVTLLNPAYGGDVKRYSLAEIEAALDAANKAMDTAEREAREKHEQTVANLPDVSGTAGGKNSSTPASKTIGPFTLRADAQPPAEKFDALCSFDAEFKARFAGCTHGLNDTSPSGIDMSLANKAALAGWSAQEIADLLVACRRNCGANLHLDNLTKFRGTIKEAKAFAEQLHARTCAPKTADDVRARVSKDIGLDIECILKTGRLYTLKLATPAPRNGATEVRIGGVDALLTLAKFKHAVFDGARHHVSGFGQKKSWSATCDGFEALIVEVAVDDDNELHRSWVRAYLNSVCIHGKTGQDEWKGALTSNAPFVREHEVALHAEELRMHVTYSFREYVERRDVHDLLRRLGFKCSTVSARFSETEDGEAAKISRSYWIADRGAVAEWAPAVGGVSLPTASKGAL